MRGRRLTVEEIEKMATGLESDFDSDDSNADPAWSPEELDYDDSK